MTESFEPRNELEHRLMQAQEGKISDEVFMEQLLHSQVFVPVEDNVSVVGIQASERAKPLVITTEDGLEVLVMFTSPERAKPFLVDNPAYHGGILVEVRWVLERTGAGLGIALNPGWPVGIDMEPDMVRMLSDSAQGKVSASK